MTQVQKKNQKPKKRLSLQNLIEQKAEIWVINQTGTPECSFGGGRPGNVILMVGTAQDHDRVTIPPGGDPICLSDQTDYESIARCRDLFKSTRPGGTLKLVDPKEAEAYYEAHEGRRTAVKQKIEDLISEARNDTIPEKTEGRVVQLNPAVSDLCLKIKHKAIEERPALERLIEIAPTFTEDDLSYLMINGKLASVKRWAKQRLTELNKGETEVEEEFNEGEE